MTSAPDSLYFLSIYRIFFRIKARRRHAHLAHGRNDTAEYIIKEKCRANIQMLRNFSNKLFTFEKICKYFPTEFYIAGLHCGENPLENS